MPKTESVARNDSFQYEIFMRNLSATLTTLFEIESDETSYLPTLTKLTFKKTTIKINLQDLVVWNIVIQSLIIIIFIMTIVTVLNPLNLA